MEHFRASEPSDCFSIDVFHDRGALWHVFDRGKDMPWPNACFFNDPVERYSIKDAEYFLNLGHDPEETSRFLKLFAMELLRLHICLNS